jgi:hypothetical protein
MRKLSEAQWNIPTTCRERRTRLTKYVWRLDVRIHATRQPRKTNRVSSHKRMQFRKERTSEEWYRKPFSSHSPAKLPLKRHRTGECSVVLVYMQNLLQIQRQSEPASFWDENPGNSTAKQSGFSFETKSAAEPNGVNHITSFKPNLQSVSMLSPM